MGIRTERFEETVGLFRDVIDLEVIRQERNVFGFRVDNFEEARARMEAEGVEFLTPTQCSEAVAWSHFRGPDGNVNEIFARR